MKYYELTIIAKDVPQLPIQPIKEQRGPNFITLEFYTEPEKIAALEKALKANSLRYMILQKEPKKEMKPRKRLPIEKSLIFDKGTGGKSPTFQRKVGEKVDLKEIDKKIEEMLKE